MGKCFNPDKSFKKSSIISLNNLHFRPFMTVCLFCELFSIYFEISFYIKWKVWWNMDVCLALPSTSATSRDLANMFWIKFKIYLIKKAKELICSIYLRKWLDCSSFYELIRPFPSAIILQWHLCHYSKKL